LGDRDARNGRASHTLSTDRMTDGPTTTCSNRLGLSRE
jgi:hypothetical protein